MNNTDNVKITGELKTIKERLSFNNELLNNKINHTTEKLGPIEAKLDLLLSKLDSTPSLSSQNISKNRLDLIESKIDYLSNYIIAASTIRLENNLAITKLFTGQRMIVDVCDMTVAQCIMFDGFDEKWVADVFLKLLKPDDIFFDLGANFGYYTILAGSIISSGKIFSFEANPDLINILNKNLIVNGLKNIGKIENYAVFNKADTMKLHTYKNSKGNSSLQKLGNEEGLVLDHIYDIETISIDNYCDINNISKVNIVKLDVEGVEDKAYYGMRKTIENNNDIKILIEYSHQRYDKPNIFYNKISKDFPFIYYILNPSGNNILGKISSYEDLCRISKGGWHDWQMLLCSKTEIII